MRADFIGIADREKLPRWAARRLEALEAPKMKIRIFQIDGERDTQRVRFMHYDHTIEHGGIDPSAYRQVYGGTVKAESLENIFMLCNTDQFPPGYCGHSLSVSDIIEVCEGKDRGFYFCDKIGFKKLDDFDIEKTDHADMMKILVLENDMPPYEAEIRHDIHAMQSVVGGLIEPVYFEENGDVLCWCNEEFLFNGSIPNRRIGETLVNGTCYIAGDRINKYGEKESCSLTDEQIAKYTQMFPQSVIVLDESADETMTESEDIDQTLS